MSRQQEGINKALELAKKGLYHKDAINKVIKADFIKHYNTAKSLTELYNTLAKRYGKCDRLIRSICNG